MLDSDEERRMEMLPTSSSDFASETTATSIDVSLLKKAQDIAASQVQALLPQPVRSANTPAKGNNIDVSA